jgi:phosphopentomutase
VYTSADSVFQIAAHEQVIPIEEQYRICQIARDLLRGRHEVGRVIARPFTGKSGTTGVRRIDTIMQVPPPAGMLLDQLMENGVDVHAVGKISDVFLGRGIALSDKTKSNAEGMATTLACDERYTRGLIFVNLVDFDQNFGHRNDVEGYANALEEVDRWLPSLFAAVGPGDAVILTADHGCDPTTRAPTIAGNTFRYLFSVGGVVSTLALGRRFRISDRPWRRISGRALRTARAFWAALRRKADTCMSNRSVRQLGSEGQRVTPQG